MNYLFAPNPIIRISGAVWAPETIELPTWFNVKKTQGLMWPGGLPVNEEEAAMAGVLAEATARLNRLRVGSVARQGDRTWIARLTSKRPVDRAEKNTRTRFYLPVAEMAFGIQTYAD